MSGEIRIEIHWRESYERGGALPDDPLKMLLANPLVVVDERRYRVVAVSIGSDLVQAITLRALDSLEEP